MQSKLIISQELCANRTAKIAQNGMSNLDT